MMIKKVGYDELGEVLELQYRAYRSEAELLGDFDIPPLRQTLAEVQEEWEKGVILKAVDESGEMIGSVRGYVEEGTLYVGKLVVAPEFRGRGIGTKLLGEMERVCSHERAELFTSSMSVRNLCLYERAGYRVFKEERVSDKLTFVYLEKLQTGGGLEGKVYENQEL